MESEQLDRRTVVSAYDASAPLHERRWEREGHRSYHRGYYEEGTEEPAAAVEQMIDRVADAASVTAGDRVLNLGCGVGDDSIRLARRRGATVIGVNVDDRQLDAARAYAADAGVADRTEFRFDDFHDLETVPGGSVDVVWGLEALCHARDDRRVVEAARRVLADGGRLAFADLFRRGDGSAADPDRLSALAESWSVRYDPIDELTAALEAAGFADVLVRDVTRAVLPAIEADARTSRYAYPYYRLLNRLGRVDDRVVALAAGGTHCAELVRSGAVGYYVVSATG